MTTIEEATMNFLFGAGDTMDIKAGFVMLRRGDKITITKWLSHKDNSWIGKKLIVEHVEDPFVIVQLPELLGFRAIHRDHVIFMKPSEKYWAAVEGRLTPEVAEDPRKPGTTSDTQKSVDGVKAVNQAAVDRDKLRDVLNAEKIATEKENKARAQKAAEDFVKNQQGRKCDCPRCRSGITVAFVPSLK